MTGVTAKRGSALLIVLGMMAFMVISAVSFAIYMRESRKPSSYLRRTATSRYLLKAALANAIASIEGHFYLDSSGVSHVEGIYDDLYPGVGPSLNDAGANNSRNGDFWDHRVFTPFGPASEELTVSTLTLEALAYLPPAIINEVRLYSRKTRTAEWHNLAFDTGRYAFCAVDVSDCFDINRVRANRRRSSASQQRFNLSALYENKATDVDRILSKADSFDIPFISLADFNVVAGQGSEFAPFMRYIGSSGSQIYNRSHHQSVSNALFITDTWFPPTNRAAQVKTFDLEGSVQHQPFQPGAFTETADLLSVDEGQTDLAKALVQNIGGVGLMCLFDYLDMDSRPISYCVPSVETVPMVTGIGLLHDNAVKPEFGVMETRAGTYDSRIPDPTGPAGSTKKYFRKATKWGLKNLGGDPFMLTGTTTYPFKRTALKDYPQNFTGEALIRIFFAPKNLPSRLDLNSPLYPKSQSDWKDGFADGVITIKAKIVKIEVNGDCKTQADTVKPWRANVTLPSVSMPAFWYVESYAGPNDKSPAITADSGPNFAPYYSLEGIRDDQKAMKPYAIAPSAGQVADWWTKANVGDNKLTGWPAAGATAGTWGDGFVQNKMDPAVMQAEGYVMHLLAWVRIIDEDGKTVDLVPARLLDDKVWGERAISEADANDLASMFKFFGSGTPVLEFQGDREFRYSQDTATTGAPKIYDGKEPETFSAWSELYAPDPRFNFAPENWVPVASDGDATAAEWLAQVTPLLGQDGRDPDIFMFTSDQQYLQSIGELAFLPALEDMDGRSKFFEGVYKDNVSARMNGSAMAARVGGGAAKTACYDFMWRTYSPCYDNIYSMTADGVPCEVVSGRHGFLANPYSQDPRIMMSVLRNTPFDYFVASTNKTDIWNGDGITVKSAHQYCFHRDTAEAKLSDEELDQLCSAFRAAFVESAKQSDAKTGKNMDWTSVFQDDAFWFEGVGDDQNRFMGVELDEVLHGVDRKYLHSFWRACFQNRQQLFLVFVRAEPLTVGGMGVGSLAAAQLGARGVALVWRDPMPPAKGRDQRKSRVQLGSPKNWREQNQQSGPHRTRILFYHQFD